MGARAGYILDTNEKERQRLQAQGDVLRPFTRRTLLAAGLKTGMKVLDVGTGIGEVAFVASELLGDSGHVYGVDIDANMVAMASRRLAESPCSNISFHHVELEKESLREQVPCLPNQYDFVVARFVVAQQPAPLAFLRSLYQQVKLGGVILIFETANSGRNSWSFPQIELYDSFVRQLLEATAHLGHDHGVGTRLVRLFAEAGIPQPQIAAEALVGGPNSEVLNYMLLNLAVILPQVEGRMPDSPSLERLERDLLTIQSTVNSENAMVLGQTVVGVWSTRDEA